MAEKFTGRFTKTFLDRPADGAHTDRTGLYLTVRNGGKARSWGIRYHGKRKTIGSAFHIPLEQAQDQLQQFKAKLKAGQDPMAPIGANAWTFADEADLFYEHKCQEEWHDDAQKLGKTMIKKYIKGTAYAKIPLADIDVGELKNILKPTWSGKTRRRSLLGAPAYDRRDDRPSPNCRPAALSRRQKNPVDLTKHGAAQEPRQTTIGRTPTWPATRVNSKTCRSLT